MTVHQGLPGRNLRLSAATIGVFDGVHRGHAAILRATRDRAGTGSAAVITFDRHPLATLAPTVAPRCLMTLGQRLEAFRAHGIRTVIVLKFNPRLAARPAEEFARTILARRLHVAHLVVGYDFHFGRGGTGDAALLQRLGTRLGFGLTVVPPALDHREPVSSTRIRRLVRLGRLPEATRLLGRPVMLAGQRVRGRRLGRKLGFPTINLRPRNELLPPHGIYAARLGRTPAVAYLGARPTVDREGAEALLEIHCLAAAPAIPTGKTVEVALVAWQRPDRKFDGVEPLRRQIARDVARARRVLGLTRGRREV